MLVVLILRKNVDFEPTYDVLNFACRIDNLFWTNLLIDSMVLQNNIFSMRGRGSGWRRGGGPPAPGAPVAAPSVVYACRPSPFDLALCESSFPRVYEYDDADLSQVCRSSSPNLIYYLFYFLHILEN